MNRILGILAMLGLGCGGVLIIGWLMCLGFMFGHGGVQPHPSTIGDDPEIRDRTPLEPILLPTYRAPATTLPLFGDKE